MATIVKQLEKNSAKREEKQLSKIAENVIERWGDLYGRIGIALLKPQAEKAFKAKEENHSAAIDTE